MTRDIQAVLRNADPAPSVPAYDDATTSTLLQKILASSTIVDADVIPTADLRADHGLTPVVTRRPSRFRMATGIAAVGAMAIAITVTVNVVSSPVAYGGIELERDGAYYLVTITDPNRDPQSLTAALKSRGLNITLMPAPVSPSLVGSIPGTTMSEGGQTITALGPEPCTVPMEPTQGCVVGLRVPVGFAGEATVVVGRAALPGEDYGAAESSVSPGELFACQDLLGRPVPDVVAELQAAGVSVEYRGTTDDDTQDLSAYAAMFVDDVLPRNATTVYVFAATTAQAHPLPKGC